jgi:hypothetical protein
MGDHIERHTFTEEKMNSKGMGKVSEIFPNHSDYLSFLGEEILQLRNEL